VPEPHSLFQNRVERGLDGLPGALVGAVGEGEVVAGVLDLLEGRVALDAEEAAAFFFFFFFERKKEEGEGRESELAVVGIFLSSLLSFSSPLALFFLQAPLSRFLKLTDRDPSR
jgi:hypothetical protein